MSIRLRELIRAVRNCKTAAEERAVVAKECAAIRTAIKEGSPYKARNVAKLMYIHMLGYPTDFGQMECINLIVSSKYPEKRIGYLALTTILDESQEVMPLIEHSLKKDLDDKNQFVQSLALTTIANISSEDICRDLSNEVEKLLFHSPYIRKKAALCAVRIVKKCPDLIDNYVEKIEELLNEKNHGVLVTTVTLISEIIKRNKKYKNQFRKLIPTLVKLEKTLLMSAYALEHDVNGIADPFLQVKILRLLRTLGKGSNKAAEAMADLLAQVIMNTENNKNSGNSILYECVKTIMEINAESGLRTLAINQLGKFLTNRDNNLRYVALQTLTKVAETDSQSVQRHLTTIVDCLKDHDLSIRKRALELIYAVINTSNIKLLAGELISYLQHSNDELKEGITVKLCILVEKYSPSNEWRIQTLLQLITLAGQFIREDIASNFVALVTQTPEMEAPIVRALYVTLKTLAPKGHLLSKQGMLLNVGCWCIGELSEHLIQGEVTHDDVLGLLTYLLENPSTTLSTKGIILTAIAKLGITFPAILEKTTAILNRYKGHHDADMQQRSIEFMALSKWDQIRDKILGRMPPIPVKVIQEIEHQQHAVTIPHEKGAVVAEKHTQPPVQQPPTTQPVQQPPVVEDNPLIDLVGLETTPIVPTTTQTTAPVGTGLDFIFETTSPVPVQPLQVPSITPVATTTAPTASQQAPSPIQTIVYDKNGVVAEFNIFKPDFVHVPDMTQVNISFKNRNPYPLLKFDFMVAVPTHIKKKVTKPTSDVVPASSVDKITQQAKLKNTEHGKKPVAIKFKIVYTRGDNNTPVEDQGEVQGIPRTF